MKIFPIVLAASLGLASVCSDAATFVIINGDDPGEGLNDPTVVAPVGSNAGTTLGAQRLNVIQAAADYWGARLDSAVPIHVNVDFDTGACDTTSAFLISGTFVTAYATDVGPVPELELVWVSGAQVNALAGEDQSPDNASIDDYDVALTINPDIDAGCDGNAGFWYDTNPAASVPANRLPLLAYAVHEIAHGLGFWLFTDPFTGEYQESNEFKQYPDIWSRFLLDLSFIESGRRWIEMFPDERASSAVNEPNLVWEGAHVNAAAAGWLDPKPIAVLHPPAAFGKFEFRKGQLGPRPPLLGFSELVVAAEDGTDPVSDGCEPLVNGAALTGRIALFDRGQCTFAVKAMAAQAAGAIGVLVANNVPVGHSPMGGIEPALVIPALGITQEAGALLRANPGARLGIGYDPTDRAGTTDGRVRMNAATAGPTHRSSSHFSDALSPTPLMHSSLYGVRTFDDDLTLPLLRDIHWPVLASAPNKPPYLDAATTFAAVVDQPSTLTELWFGDSDAEDSPLTLRLQVGSGSIELESAGGVTIAGSGSNDASATAPRSLLLPYVARGGIRFRSAAGDSSDVALTVTVNDNGNTGSGGAQATVDTATIDVGTTGNAPSATPQSLSTDEDTALDIELAGSDPDSDRLAFAVVTPPQHGTLGGALGLLRYTPQSGYAGPDAFTFVALDGVLVSSAASIDITVNSVNDAPIAGALAGVTLPAGVAASFSVASAFTDPDGDTLGFSATGLPASLVLIGASGQIIGTPLQAEVGVHPVQITASDGTLTATANFSLTIAGANIFGDGFED